MQLGKHMILSGLEPLPKEELLYLNFRSQNPGPNYIFSTPFCCIKYHKPNIIKLHHHYPARDAIFVRYTPFIIPIQPSKGTAGHGNPMYQCTLLYTHDKHGGA
jgi:hypothetical protein